ncbi:MAG TPA: hypothetical protein VEC11_12695 [Allosphingosinicella sp.]|nr:hypothetical protein [Allosphingosinicella sp.]
MPGKLFRLSLLAIGMSLLLSGCAAQHSIFRNRTVRPNGPSIITVDAKQRAYLAVPTLPVAGTNTAGAARPGQIRICAEPPPDFASVIAQSLSASGSFGQSADPQSVQAAASLAQSSSEQGATIARTQTINMLRELMYRTCERYLNGAITDLELPIQAIRDQRLMVAILAIEQLTGVATPPATVIGAGGGASAGASSADAVVRLDDARKRLETADASQRSRQTEYDALEGAAPSCTSIETAAAASPPTLTPEQTNKRPNCANALTALNRAKAERTGAAEAYQVLRDAMSSGGAGPASATTTVQQGDHSAGESAQGNGAAMEKVADAVQEIVRLNYAQDEFGLFCLRFVTMPQPELADLRAECRTYLVERVRLDAARANSEARRLYAADRARAAVAIDNLDRSQFGIFWAKVAPGGTFDRTRLSTLINAYVNAFTFAHGRAPPMTRLRELQAVTDEAGARRAFSRVDDEARDFLAREGD